MAALAVVTVAAGSIARARAWILVGAGMVALAPAPWAVVAVGAVAIGVAGGLVGDLPHRRVLGALCAGLVLQGAVRIDLGRFGVSAFVVAAVVATLVGSAWPLTHRSTRSRARLAVLVVGGVAGLIVASFGLTVLRSGAGLRLAVQRTEEGLAAARAGDVDAAGALLREASVAFADARDDLASWSARPAVVIPVIGQHQRALRTLAAAGADVSGAAAGAVAQADLRGVGLSGGRIDLTRLTAMTAPLDALVGALERADGAITTAESPWLLPPLARRVDAVARLVAESASDAELAADAAGVLPGVLGGRGERRYFVAFGTPAESRELGGFTGAYGLLTADDGRLVMTRTGRIQDLNDAGVGRQLTDPTQFPDRYRALRPEDFWQNVTGTPDFPTVAEAVRQMWPQSGGGALDGVLYLDPRALSALLALTGPVQVPGRVDPLSAETTEDYLLHGQYEAFTEIDQRSDFLLAIARAVFDQLASTDVPSAGALSDALGPSGRQRRLLAHSFHVEEQRLFTDLGIDGAVPPVRGDFVAVTSSNLGQNKIDAFLDRSIDYEVVLDPAAAGVTATATVTLRNTAPSSGLADYVIGNRSGAPPGTNLSVLALYTPLRLTAATSGGKAVSVGANEEYGRQVYSVLVAVPAGAEISVRFALQGRLDLRDGYRLDVMAQPTANPEHLDVRVAVSGHGAVRGSETLSTTLDGDVALLVDLRSGE